MDAVYNKAAYHAVFSFLSSSPISKIIQVLNAAKIKAGRRNKNCDWRN